MACRGITGRSAFHTYRTRLNVAGIVQSIWRIGYGLNGPGGSNPARGKRSLSYPKVSGLSLWPTLPPVQFVPGVRWPGREVNHSPRSSAEGKNEWSWTSTPLYAFITRTGRYLFFTFCRVGPGQLDVTISCLDLAQYRNQWQSVVNTVMNFRFP